MDGWERRACPVLREPSQLLVGSNDCTIGGFACSIAQPACPRQARRAGEAGTLAENATHVVIDDAARCVPACQYTLIQWFFSLHESLAGLPFSVHPTQLSYLVPLFLCLPACHLLSVGPHGLAGAAAGVAAIQGQGPCHPRTGADVLPQPAITCHGLGGRAGRLLCCTYVLVYGAAGRKGMRGAEGTLGSGGGRGSEVIGWIKDARGQDPLCPLICSSCTLNRAPPLS